MVCAVRAPATLSPVERYVFKIGEAFPADDERARFVVALAMMSNDVLRSFAQLDVDESDPEAAGVQMWLFRQQAALYFEAATFIADSARVFPKIAAFLSGLPQEARDELEQIAGGIDPKSAHYVGGWLADHRNLTFHYSEMHPAKAARGTERWKQALEAAAPLEGDLTHGEKLGSIRFGFADQVAAQWVPPDTETDTIIRLREALLALVRFTQRAITAYLQALPSSAWRHERR
jgi:hypothetical protein